MSVHRNESIFNSSDEGEAIQLSGSSPASVANNASSLPHHSPASVVNNASSLPHHNYLLEASPDQLQPRHAFLGEASPDQPQMQLGVDLGRRLARLELGNELNKQQLVNVNQKADTYAEAFVMENARVGDLEGKVISMEARLLSEEKLGLDVKEKIGKLEEELRKKDKEILELKDMLVKHKTERAKHDERFNKLERENGELTSQFVTLLDTCQTFNDELQSLKKMNFEIKRQLKKEESHTSATNPKFSSLEVQQIVNSPISQPHPMFQNHSTIVSTSHASPDPQSDPTTVPTSCVTPAPPSYPTRVVHNSLSNSVYVHKPTPTLGSQRNTTNIKDATKLDCIPLTSHQTSYMNQELLNQSYNPNLYNSAPAAPVHYPEATDPTGLIFYPPGVEANLMYHCGSTSQSDGLEVNPDFSAYYYRR